MMGPYHFIFYSSMYNCLSVAPPPPPLYWWELWSSPLTPVVPAVESLEYVNEVLVVGLLMLWFHGRGRRIVFSFSCWDWGGGGEIKEDSGP